MQELFHTSPREIAVFLAILAFYYLCIAGFMACDCLVAVHRAKMTGTYRSSRKFRRTFDKAVMYYIPTFMMTLVDFMIMFAVAFMEIPWIPHFPFVTLFAVAAVGWIEIKSVHEKRDAKERAKIEEAVEALVKLSKDRDIAGMLETVIAAAKSVDAEKERLRKESEAQNTTESV